MALIDFLRSAGNDGYKSLIAMCGSAEAKRLVELPRRDMILSLRFDHRLTLEQIAAILGVTRQRVHQIVAGSRPSKEPEPKAPRMRIARTLVAMGIPVPEHKAWFEQKLLREEYSQMAVGEMLGVPQTTVSVYVRKLGLDMLWRRAGIRLHQTDDNRVNFERNRDGAAHLPGL